MQKIGLIRMGILSNFVIGRFGAIWDFKIASGQSRTVRQGSVDRPTVVARTIWLWLRGPSVPLARTVHLLAKQHYSNLKVSK
jgi:hypothetical protein